MATPITFNLKTFAQLTSCLILTLIMTSCPVSDEDCIDYGSIAEVPDLILLAPESIVYTRGEELTLKLEIPATNSYFGSELILYGTTADNSARLVLGFSQLFLENNLTFIKGSQSEFTNWFNMPYNLNIDAFSLEIIIRLDEEVLILYRPMIA